MKFYAMIVPIFSLLIANSPPANLAQPERAYAEVAREVCDAPTAFGYSRKISGGVTGVLDTNKFLNRIVKLGGSVEFKYSNEDWKGPLQKDFGDALTKANGCRERVFNSILRIHSKVNTGTNHKSADLKFNSNFHEGILVASNEKSPVTSCNIGKDNLIVLIGGSVVFTDKSEMTAIKADNMPLLIIKRVYSGLKIDTLRIFDDRNNIIARIYPDKYWVSPDVRMENSDRHTLKVYDHLDNEVLSIHFINKNYVKITGIFRGPRGQIAEIGDNSAKLISPSGQEMATISNSCLGASGSGAGLQF